MQALFVHGMGRTPLSGWPMLHYLRQAGLTTHSFGYFVSTETFDDITARLVKQITMYATKGPYILIGHSLGGVLIRAALALLDDTTTPPEHVFLLGSPIYPSRLAKSLSQNGLFRLITNDCGKLLASDERMQSVLSCECPTTAIIGVKGIDWKHGPFNGDANDSVVAVSEVSAEWLTDVIELPIVHGWLPSSPLVAEKIIVRLKD